MGDGIELLGLGFRRFESESSKEIPGVKFDNVNVCIRLAPWVVLHECCGCLGFFCRKNVGGLTAD